LHPEISRKQRTGSKAANATFATKLLKGDFMSSRLAFFAVPFVCLGFSACSGGEPSESEMRGAFDRAMRAEANVESIQIKEFQKMTCKQAGDRPGYVCDFFADGSATFQYLGPQKIHRNITGRFFADKSGLVQFSPELRG
jgi:outer membrane lipoprotein-sorting protein